MSKMKELNLVKSLSLTAFILTFILGIYYYFVPQSPQLSTVFLEVSILFLIPLALANFNFKRLSRLLFSIVTPLAIMWLSIVSKNDSIALGNSNAVNYFDIRMLLLCSVIIPFAIIGIKDKRLLIIGIIPSFLSLMLFDPIHDYFNVGFYDSGFQSDDYYLSANLYSFLTFIFLSVSFIFLLIQNRNSEFRYIRKSKILQEYLDRLVELSQSTNIQNGYVDKVKEEIIKTIADTDLTSRVSIWNYSAEKNQLECNFLFDAGKLNTENTYLDLNKFPKYLEIIKMEKIIISDDVLVDPNLLELKDYMISNNIRSMLDVPFFKDGEIRGVICLEHQNEIKKWMPEEIIFLKALGDFLSYAIITEKLSIQFQVIKEKNEEIEIMNKNLENRISLRIKELATKNEQLSAYAFLNSHKLRGPIARIEGLINVLELTQNDKIPDDLLQPIRDSIIELDNVSREINKSIEQYGSIEKSFRK